MELRHDTRRGWRENYYLKSFLLGLGLAFALFLPFLIVDGGRFLFYGDFNVQQVPFYRLAHDAVRAGEWGWNYRTDLGANFIGSYSFYLLGSPFFWLTLPFPSEWVQFLMGPLLILKFGCATFTGYVYLHRYTKTGEAAMIGAVLYAFSGFSIYNVFFNHFHEAIVFFPLLLAALDEYMATRRRGLFALAVFGCCFVNYYFFVGQVTFTLIYFFLRLLCGSWRISLRDFLLLVLEAVLGVGLACCLLVPSVLAVLQNDRVDNPINGWNALLYNKNQRYIHIIECFFFPPDLPARPNFTPESESKWASLGAWLPLFGMTGVLGWLQLRRKHWLKKMLYVLFVMALIPFLNAAFQLFNSSYYARWFYMLTLMMALATILALEEQRTNWKRALTWSFAITAAIAGLIGGTPVLATQDGERTVTFGLEQYPARFWATVAVSALSLAGVGYLFRFRRGEGKGFTRSVTALLSVTVVLYGVFFIATGKTQTEYVWDHLIPYSLNGGKDIDLTDLQECRSDFYESVDNAGMFWEIPNIQAFHSIVPGSVMEFYKSIGVTRDVASRPGTDHYSLRGLVSVHWLFDDDHDDTYFAGEEISDPAMPGWVYYGNANGFDIWENQNYIPMGFSYEYFITRSDWEKLGETDRERCMLRALVIEDEDRIAMEAFLRELPQDQRTFLRADYEKDCADRAATAGETFQYTQSGFLAERNAPREQVVFFSVPWESGWSAKVNGEDAAIYRVNVGFMAVLVPQGERVGIEFTYRTPGLSAGVLITVVSALVLAGYLFLARRWRRREAPAPHDPGRYRYLDLEDYARALKTSFLRQPVLRAVTGKADQNGPPAADPSGDAAPAAAAAGEPDGAGAPDGGPAGDEPQEKTEG